MRLLLIGLLTVFFLAGCVLPAPIPHVTKQSPRVSGRVVDTDTGLPVTNATVRLVLYKAQARSYARGSRESWEIYLRDGRLWCGTADAPRAGARAQTKDDG